MSRFDDADLLFATATRDEGLSLEDAKPFGTTQDVDRILHALRDEAIGAAYAVRGDGTEFFAAGFMLGLVAAHAEGLAWVEWICANDRLMPLVNLGSMRAAARRIAAGGHE